MFRFDQSHQQTPTPRIAETISVQEVTELLSALADRNRSLSEIAQRIAQFPALSRRVLRMANSALTGTRNEITDAAHAVSMLGSRRLAGILTQLPRDPSGGYRLPDSDVSSTAA